MSQFFAKSEPQLIPCERGYSFFFDLIDRLWKGPNSQPIHRVCTLMRKMQVTCFVSEDLELNDELLAEKADAVARCDGELRHFDARRLTFFRQQPNPASWRDLDKLSCLGCVIIVTMVLPDNQERSYLLESVVRSPCVFVPTHDSKSRAETITNYYVHCTRQFPTTIGTRRDNLVLTMEGSFFSQQNCLTHVCAHAALRMAINSCPAYNGPKLTNRRINDMLDIKHKCAKDRIGRYQQTDECAHCGLDKGQIAEVARELGFSVLPADFSRQPQIDYADYAYPFVESHCPVILGIERPLFDRPIEPRARRPVMQHVVTILGHTINSDRWNTEARWGYGAVPDEEYSPSSEWCDHFVISDDNYGMYLALPTEMIKNFLVPRFNANLHAVMALALVPSGVEIAGYFAERASQAVAQDLLQRGAPQGDHRWFSCLKHHRFVCRTLLQTPKEYLAWARTSHDSDGHDLTHSAIYLDVLSALLHGRSHVWVTEITLPNIYVGNKHKLGDIITAADVKVTKSEDLYAAVILAWLPAAFYIRPAIDVQPYEWPLTAHVPLIRRSGGPPLLEW